ncbi:protein FAR1-RELATED SEQUENCE 5-like [Pyrus ussuriensis x Pyrus communis]|uniref:Protein FAR1-RELATED SEQUENCE 5-like n=1 Tax=Pyrus ussuriensis x Pyrus communis TaxID=2448454 RepID=A0A5N5HTF0_9ROSA|nr:protein FAR1-RELATED SEQUENCE 5-like [Pyrus x bretschneideri]KAB2630013.1 protein FAR1-RELATED SEQUENCE 5-like [Pyrus ussuriensis x Pyrus communis]
MTHESDGASVGTSLVDMSHLFGQDDDDDDDQRTPNSCKDGSSLVQPHEPYVGQEFDSQESALAFYNAYATRMGFVTRMNDMYRSKHDGTVIGRTLVCNKEGFRKPDRRDKKTLKPRAQTRVGCRAMLSIKKLSVGKWVVTWFVREHTHALTPNKALKGLVNDQVPDDKTKIAELTNELFLERKRSAALREIVDLLFNHIEEHTQDLSKKVQHVVDNVKELESEGKNRRSLG